jgi:integrase
MARKAITKRSVDAMKPGELLADVEVRGFVARRLPSGVITYGFRYRDRATGKRRWMALGLHGQITPDQARDLAKKHAGAVASHRDPQAELQEARAVAAATGPGKTVDALLDEFLARHVRKGGLRTADEIESLLTRHVRPRIGQRPIYELRRSEIVEMLDAIEDEISARTADKALSILRKAFNWYAPRDDQFNSPIVRGMARTKLRELSRDRILADDEIREIWAALSAVNPVYARIVQGLLRSAQRLNEVARLTWEEVDAKGEAWTVPADRYKSKVAHTVPIVPPVALLLGERPKAVTKKNQFVFSTTGGAAPFSGFSRAKAALDKAIAAARRKAKQKPMPAWRLHDLRRTARSLMARAGVHADVAERVLGHLQPGVKGIYDRHAYLDEKREALTRLNSLIDRILEPPAENVIPLERAPRSVEAV